MYSGKWPVCILPTSVSLHAGGGTFPDWARFGCFAGELLRASVTALFSPLPVSSSFSSFSLYPSLFLSHYPASLSLVNCFCPLPCPKIQPRSRSPSATSSLLVLLPVCRRYASILDSHSLFRVLRPVADSHTLVDSYHVCAINNSLSRGDIGMVIGFGIGRIG